MHVDDDNDEEVLRADDYEVLCTSTSFGSFRVLLWLYENAPVSVIVVEGCRNAKLQVLQTARYIKCKA
eukprot:scaffold466897_cov23-Prasinocladus_malaysianus.AAC.1